MTALPIHTAPGVVTNVKVVVYRPLSEENNLTGLVLWTPPVGSIIDSYSISVSVGGTPVAVSAGGMPVTLVRYPNSLYGTR